MRDVGDDEADERDADRRDLRVVATRAAGSEIAMPITATSGQRTPSRSVLSSAVCGAEHEIDARDREHENQRDQPRQARARQVLLHVEVAKVLLEQDPRSAASRSRASADRRTASRDCPGRACASP